MDQSPSWVVQYNLQIEEVVDSKKSYQGLEKASLKHDTDELIMAA